MKASLAAIDAGRRRCVERRLRGDVIVAAVVDEEVESVGTEALAAPVARRRGDRRRADRRAVCVAHKGFVAFEVETRGRAAHGSRPDLGVDAIAHMGAVLVGNRELDARSARGPAIRCSAPGRCTRR